MILQKKQAYLNKVLSKHYKKLTYTLFNKTKNISALKNATGRSREQSIGISILTIDTISHKDFPDIVDVTVLNGLRKTKKAVILYKGKATVPTRLTRCISKLAQEAPRNKKSEKEVSNTTLLSHGYNRKLKNDLVTLGIIDNMLGTGICMHNYKLCFNFELSLQYFNFLKCKQKIKLKNLDRLQRSLILPQRISEAKAANVNTQNQKILKKKEVRLSKMELSSVITQVLHKIHFFKDQKALRKSVFNIKKLSNVLGAFVEINSKIYFISDKELKQCGLAGKLKHSGFHSNIFLSANKATPLLKNLVYSKTPTEKNILLKTKCIQPNIIFFNFLNIATRTYVIYNIKRIFNKLINILSILAVNP